MKKVIFIAYFFPPLGGAGVWRSLKFAKYLPEFGWQPIIISAAASVSYGKDWSLLEEIPQEIEIHRIGHHEPKWKAWQYSRSKLKIAFDFPDSFRRWYSPAYREASGILQKEKVNLIFSSSAPFTSHLIAMKLKKKFNIPWVADFRDPWSGNDELNLHYAETLMQPLRNIMLSKIKNAENNILKTADKIVVASWYHKQQLCELHQVQGDKIAVITNGYDESDFAGIKGLNLYPNKLTIYFVGSFYSGFKKIASDFTNVIVGLNKRTEIVIVGKAASVMNQDVAMDNLTCIYNIPKAKMLAFCLSSDFLLLIMLPSAMWIPGKIFEYLRLGKPILALVPEEGDAAKIIKEANAGFILSYDKEEMKKQLKEILGKYKEGAFKDSLINYQYISQFERRETTERLAKKFDEVINELER